MLCFSVVLLVTGRGPAPIAAPAAIGGPFRLTDQNGQTITDRDLKGRPFLVFFGFTHCPEVCPTALFDISEIFSKLGPDADKVNALFITVDPERDTPDEAEGLSLELQSAPDRASAATPRRSPRSRRPIGSITRRCR